MPASGVGEHRIIDIALRYESIKGLGLGLVKWRTPMETFWKNGVGEERLAKGHRLGVAGRERGLCSFQREAFVGDVCFVELPFQEEVQRVGCLMIANHERLEYCRPARSSTTIRRSACSKRKPSAKAISEPYGLP